jgi:tetratricopeptide (TPR) repeat protein
MSQSPPASLLVSPDLRRRLQQRYEEAARLAHQPQPDRGRIHELLAECLRADPGNILYLDALVANLRLWDRRPAKSWLPRWLWRSGQKGSELDMPGKAHWEGAAGTQNSVRNPQYESLQNAPAALLADFANPAVFRRLAEAAADCGFDQAELRYWQLAVERAAGDVETTRGLALALTRQGCFEEAAATWGQLASRAPDDSEAKQALADLEAEAACRFDENERSLKDAQSAAGASLYLIEQREQLLLARSEHRLSIARRRAEHDPHSRAQTLVERLEIEHNRLEIDIFHLRAERLPGDAAVRIELARRLKRARNFSGAVQRLEEARRLQGEDAETLVELGECWQHLRQFAKALDLYRQATAAGGEAKLATLAHYRAGVLAAAMGQPAEASEHFGHVLASEPKYKDAQQRLDNLLRK